MKRIVVCCGNAINTSTIIEMNLKEFLDTQDFDYEIIKCMISELDSHIQGKDVDLIVSNGRLGKEDLNIPIVVGMGYITGIGVDKINEKILEVLKPEKKEEEAED